jgi:hypothetical protein
MAFGGIDPATVEKARGLPAGVAGRDVSQIVAAMQGVLRRNQENQFQGRPFARPEEWSQNQFSSGVPFSPQPLDRPRDDTGQASPRLWEYPVYWNVQIGNNRYVDWDTLFKASDSPLLRACIELRKTEISTLEWGIRVAPKAAAAIARRSGRFDEDVARELRDSYQDEIDRLTDFWEVPDRKNGVNFTEWVGLAMDEQLTHDALSVYPHLTYGGDLVGLWIIDGSTIMPLMDETGGRPAQPYPAFQQIMYGFPRGEFTAQVIERDGQKLVPGGMLASQLVYRRRVPRRRSPYGFSPTEQALLDGLLYTKRFGWMLAEYTAGTMPAQFIESDGQIDWTPTQLQDYERYLNDRYGGQTEERMRFGMLPPGLKAAMMAQPGERYRPDYDLHLVKLLAMHYQVTATELGFTDTGGLGSTGYHEGQEDIGFRKSRLPDLRWFGGLITEISKTYLNMPKELEFYFLGLDSEDEAAADALDQNRVASGRMTLNESRARQGLPAYDFDEADMPQLQTARGIVFIEDASKTAPAGVMIEPASESNQIEGDLSSAQVKSPTQRRPIQSGGGKTAKSLDDLAIEEMAKFIRWDHEHPGAARPFRCEHLTKELAVEFGLNGYDDRIEFAKAGGAAPKAPGQGGSLTSSWSPYTHRS